MLSTSVSAAAAGRAAGGRVLPPCLDQKIARLYHGMFHAVAAGGKILPPLLADPVTEPWSCSAAAAAKMEAQPPPVFTRWPQPQSLGSSDVAPAAPTALCVVARDLLAMDRPLCGSWRDTALLCAHGAHRHAQPRVKRRRLKTSYRGWRRAARARSEQRCVRCERRRRRAIGERWLHGLAHSNTTCDPKLCMRCAHVTLSFICAPLLRNLAPL